MAWPRAALETAMCARLGEAAEFESNGPGRAIPCASYVSGDARRSFRAAAAGAAILELRVSSAVRQRRTVDRVQ